MHAHGPTRGLALAALLLLSYGGSPRPIASAEEDEGAAVPPGEMRAKVRVVAAVQGELPTLVRALGTVVARPGGPGAVVAPVAGLVLSVDATEGARVSAGAPLVHLDDRPYAEALVKAKAALRTAQAERDRALTYSLDADAAELERAAAEARALVAPALAELERVGGLRKEGLSTEKAETDARVAWQSVERSAAALEAKARLYREKGRRVQVASLEAAVAQAQADVPPAERALAATVVASPVAGRVTRVLTGPGRMAEAGALLAEILADDDVALRVALGPADAEALAPKARVTVDGRDLAAEVLSVGAATDADTGLVSVLAAFRPAAAGLRIGETFLVAVERGPAVKGIVVPAVAVEMRDDATHVMTLDAAGIAHAVPVAVLARSAVRVVIRGAGLSPGTRVVVEGNVHLPDGAATVPADEKAAGEGADPSDEKEPHGEKTPPGGMDGGSK